MTSSEYLISFLMVAWPVSAYAEAACDIENTKKLYLQLDTNDREARRDFVRSRAALSQKAKERGSEITDEEMIEIIQGMKQRDTKNQVLLEEIIATCGWPTYEKWGKTPVYAAVTVALHAPSAYRKKYFPNVEAGFKLGDVSEVQYAQYVDKMLTSEKKPQRYGTQQFSIKDGPVQLRPVEDPAHLNDRRQALGLMPLAGFPMPTNWPDSTPPQQPKVEDTVPPQAGNTK